MEKKRILLDMDGVLSDFISGAVNVLNRTYDKDITMKQYATEFGEWGTYDYYGITVEEFWRPINQEPNFWINLKPYPWYKELYNSLCDIGEVTIVTSPSEDPDCMAQKLKWARHYLGISITEMFFGSRKYLMAGNGILIDDYSKNTEAFATAGGESILIPSNWNTPDISFDKVWDTIQKNETIQLWQII